MNRRPPWADTLARTARGSREFIQATDVVVVGGGITGLAAALALARRGARATVLEAHRVGWGASSRSAGMVLSGLKLGPEALVAKFGLETARRLDAASIAAIDRVERLVGEEGIECEFARCGHIALACKPSHYHGFQRAAELLQRNFGRMVRTVAKEELPEEIGSELYCGGLIDEASAGINPAKYLHGLTRAAEQSGVTVYENAPAEKIERQAASFRVTCGQGTCVARDVLVATGAYTGSLMPALQRRIIPIGSYVIATQPLPAALAREIIPRSRMAFDSRRFLHYYRLTSDRRLLFGGRASFFAESADLIDKSAAILRRDMIALFPQLRDAAVDYAWGGSIDFTFDMLPHAGKINGLYYALGYAGHGIAMATHLGTQIARVMAGESLDDPLLGRPLPGAPLGCYYDGRPWFLPFAAAWHRFVDWVS